MEQGRNKAKIVMVDDDEDDCILVEEALKSGDLNHELLMLSDGDELIDYLHREGRYKDLRGPYPDLIILDLNMPKKDGYQALREIRQDLILKDIPITVLTGSSKWGDILRCYDLGATTVFTKGEWFQDIISIIEMCATYWFRCMTTALQKSSLWDSPITSEHTVDNSL